MVSVRSTMRKESSAVDADTPLLWVLGDLLGMTGTEFGCGIAQQATCAVQLEGMADHSCRLHVGRLRQGH